MLAAKPMSIFGVYAFESIGDGLLFIPLAARRVLDVLGRKLSLDAWHSLSLEDRRRVVDAGTGQRVDRDVAAVLDRAIPPASRAAEQSDPDEHDVPAELAASLGDTRTLDGDRWRGLSPLDRYALVKVAPKPEKLAHAYDQIVGSAHDQSVRASRAPAERSLTHLTSSGEARMVDVGEKLETRRRAVASARVHTTREAVQAIAAGSLGKGDALASARIAGILAAKRVHELVPLCHPVRTTHATIGFELDAQKAEVRISGSVEGFDRTGVEMEAMLAVSIASLTVYDMIKSLDRWATIDLVRLEAKSGGKSGDLARPPERRGA